MDCDLRVVMAPGRYPLVRGGGGGLGRALEKKWSSKGRAITGRNITRRTVQVDIIVIVSFILKSLIT